MRGFYGRPVEGRDYIYGDLITYKSGEMAIIPRNDQITAYGFECDQMSKRIQVDPSTVHLDMEGIK